MPGSAVVVVLADGGRLPPPLTPVALVTEWSPVGWAAALVVVTAVAYLTGVWRLHRRGVRWPALRTLAFCVGGLGSIAAVTVSGVAAYDTVLFSVHMVQHMVLLMISPVFLALGAPVTLALRTLPHRPRGWLLAVLHSRFARLVTFPLVTFPLFVFSSYVLYFTGLYEATLRNGLLHDLVHVHFLLAGSLFFWPLIGLDPVPGRVAYPLRALLMFASLPFHAILGLTIMQSTTVLAGDYYRSLHLSWVNPLADQQVGGGLLWASGDAVGLLMLGALVVQWIRASEREAARIDRALDREEAQRARDSIRLAGPIGSAGTVARTDESRIGP